MNLTNAVYSDYLKKRKENKTISAVIDKENLSEKYITNKSADLMKTVVYETSKIVLGAGVIGIVWFLAIVFFGGAQ